MNTCKVEKQYIGFYDEYGYLITPAIRTVESVMITMQAKEKLNSALGACADQRMVDEISQTAQAFADELFHKSFLRERIRAIVEMNITGNVRLYWRAWV